MRKEYEHCVVQIIYSKPQDVITASEPFYGTDGMDDYGFDFWND